MEKIQIVLTITAIAYGGLLAIVLRLNYLLNKAYNKLKAEKEEAQNLRLELIKEKGENIKLLKEIQGQNQAEEFLNTALKQVQSFLIDPGDTPTESTEQSQEEIDDEINLMIEKLETLEPGTYDYLAAERILQKLNSKK